MRSKMNRNKFERVWLCLNNIGAHFFFLKWSGINAKELGSVYTTSLHIPWVHGIYITIWKKIFQNIILSNNAIILFMLLGSGDVQISCFFAFVTLGFCSSPRCKFNVCILLVYQQYLQENHHCLICLRQQLLSLLNVEIATIRRTILDIKAILITLL